MARYRFEFVIYRRWSRMAQSVAWLGSVAWPGSVAWLGESRDALGHSALATVDDEFEAVPGHSFLAMLRCPQPATITRKQKVAINLPPRGKQRSAALSCTCYTIKNLPETADNSWIIPSSRSSLLFSKLFRHYRHMPTYEQFEAASIFSFATYSSDGLSPFPSYLKVVLYPYVKPGSQLFPVLKKKLRVWWPFS